MLKINVSLKSKCRLFGNFFYLIGVTQVTVLLEVATSVVL